MYHKAEGCKCENVQKCIKHAGRCRGQRGWRRVGRRQESVPGQGEGSVPGHGVGWAESRMLSWDPSDMPDPNPVPFCWNGRWARLETCYVHMVWNSETGETCDFIHPPYLSEQSGFSWSPFGAEQDCFVHLMINCWCGVCSSTLGNCYSIHEGSVSQLVVPVLLVVVPGEPQGTP